MNTMNLVLDDNASNLKFKNREAYMFNSQEAENLSVRIVFVKIGKD